MVSDDNLSNKELDDTKHQVDFLLNQANDLMESVQNKDNDYEKIFERKTI